jgi:quinol monooxygenase YgiN
MHPNPATQMSRVVVVSKMRAHPERQADAERALRALIAPTHSEAGVLLYALHRGADDPALFYFIEHYESREHLEQHLQSEHVRSFAALADELFVEGPAFDVLNTVPDGNPSKGILS